VKVLVVGGGGREHAIVWKLAKSPQIDELYAAPGNPGIERLATCVNIAAEDIPGLAEFAKKNNIDLTVVGPEAPLVAGIVDEFKNRGLTVFGPDKAAAQIEGSKIFSKNLMKKYNIPTADYKVFEDPKDAISYIDTAPMPIVVKADGLAAGKGVIIAPDRSTAKEAIKTMMIDKAFGKSGSRIVLEEYLEGPEVTVLAFCDGKRAVPMVSSRDHKRVFDNNKGPNTGGMGAVSPAPAYTPEIAEIVERDIIQRTIDAMASEGAPFQGVLYTGLMITKNGPKVLEYNCRFGDPEAQVVIPRLKTDLVEVMQAVIDGDLTNAKIEWKSEVAVCVVIASGGYPGHYETGKIISGLDDAEKNGSIVFHAGTAEKDGKIITVGGRVLGVTALGKDVDEARKLAYESVSKIRFEGMHYRKDIGL